MTRWQKFYVEDPRIASVAASHFSRKAAEVFQREHKTRILDVACGTGRDSFSLAGYSLDIIGGDLAYSGLTIARQKRLIFTQKHIDFIQMDARNLPFEGEAFEGVYCFGLLHEFTRPDGWQDISGVMEEIYRVLEPGGILQLAVLEGNPTQGLPHVLLFSEEMFDQATAAFTRIEKGSTDDTGCTGREDYHTWQGVFRKAP